MERAATPSSSRCRRPLRLEPTPDDKRIAAIMWGPLVLAGDLGPRRESRGEGAPGQPVPLLVAAERPVTEWVLPGARQGDFQIKQVARPITQPDAVEDVSLDAVLPDARAHVQRLLRRRHADGVRRARRGAGGRARAHSSHGSRDGRIRSAGRPAAGAELQLSRAIRPTDRWRARMAVRRGGHGVVLVRPRR